MKVLDLTHTIAEDMPVYPGTERPILAQANTYEKDGFKETLMTMFSHTGTHMDPPAHLFAGRTTLDQMPIEQFVGTAWVVDCTDLKEGDRIDMAHIDKEKADQADFLLFNLGWDKRWGTDEYFKDYAYIDDDVVNYLKESKKKGAGLDVIGIDPIPDEYLTIHRKLFAENEFVVIENLCNLDKLRGKLFTFCALPMKWKNADGAPIRAIALY